MNYFERLRQSITCPQNKFTQGTTHAFKNDTTNWMDMNTLYGGFDAALIDELVWVMNVVSTNSPNSLNLNRMWSFLIRVNLLFTTTLQD